MAAVNPTPGRANGIIAPRLAASERIRVPVHTPAPCGPRPAASSSPRIPTAPVLQWVVRRQGRHEVIGSAEAPLAVMRRRVREAEKDVRGFAGGEALVWHPPMLQRERTENKGRWAD
jgi:hypothetical protein